MKPPKLPPGLLQLLFVMGVVGIALFTARMLRSQHQPPQRNAGEELVIAVDAVDISPQPYRIRFSSTGVVQARTEVEIVPQVSGRVVEVAAAFDDGGVFAADEILFRVEKEDFLLEERRLEADVARAGTALELERARAQTSIRDWRRLNDDRTAPPLVKREPQLREAEMNLRAAEAQLDKARLQSKRADFRLPAAGRVLESRIAPGQFVQAGVSYGRVFYFEDLEVLASLDDRQLNWLYGSRDPEITVTATFLGETITSRARLDRGAASLDPDTRFASVRFSLGEASASLLPGVFVQLDILGPTHQGISRIPLEAVQQGGHLWLVDDESRLRRHTPQILYRAPDHLALRGLEGSTRVLTTRLPGAVEGARVKRRGEDRGLAAKESREL